MKDGYHEECEIILTENVSRTMTLSWFKGK